MKRGDLVIEMDSRTVEALLDALDCFDRDALDASKKNLSAAEYERLLVRIERGRNKLARALTKRPTNNEEGEESMGAKGSKAKGGTEYGSKRRKAQGKALRRAAKVALTKEA